MVKYITTMNGIQIGNCTNEEVVESLDRFYTTFDYNQDGACDKAEWMAFYGMVFDWEWERAKEAEEVRRLAEIEAAKPKRVRV